jgi:ribosomal protein S18 acetylase RimI-like enzyme
MKNNLIISNKFMVMSLCFVAYFSTIAAMEPLQQRLCKRSEVPGELVVEKKIRLITPEEVALAEVQTTVKVLCDGVSRSSYSLVKFKPQGPGDYDNSQQFGLKVLDQGQEIGHIVYEAFSDEDEDADSDEEIIVEKAYRKQNLGRRLLDKACQHLQALNCDSIVLVAAPEEKSMLQKLVGFYTKAGFRVENKEDLPKIVASSDDNPAVPMYKKLRK